MTSVLIFAHGDFTPGIMVERALASLPDAYVIAADGGARAAVNAGAKPNLVIGDMDSVDPDLLENLQSEGVEIRRYPTEKDETDLELALKAAALQAGHPIRILGALGGRLDHTLSNIYLLALPELAGCDVRLVSGNQEAWLMPPGEAAISGAKGDTLSLVPLNGAVEGVETENLYYPLRAETLKFGPARGVSNVMTADRAIVRSRRGELLIIHTVGKA